MEKIYDERFPQVRRVTLREARDIALRVLQQNEQRRIDLAHSATEPCCECGCTSAHKDRSVVSGPSGCVLCRWCSCGCHCMGCKHNVHCKNKPCREGCPR